MTKFNVRALGAAAASLALISGLSTPAFAAKKEKAPAPIGAVGAAPQTYVSPLDEGFKCVRAQADQHQGRPIRVSVGKIADYTGKFSNEAVEGGYRITQGGALIAISALSKLGPNVQLIERLDTANAEMDAKLAAAGLLSDFGIARGTAPVDGADYYIVGGITNLADDISSGGLEAGRNGAGAGFRTYTIAVDVDLRLVDVRTLQVVDVASFQKKIVGHEFKLNVFRFFGGSTLWDVNGGIQKNEPLPMAVRATIDSAVLQLVSNGALKRDFGQCKEAVDYGFN